MVSVRVWVEKADLGLATEEMMKGKGARCMDIESLNTYCLQPIFRNSSEGDMGNPARSVGGRKKPAKMIDTARPCTITRYVLNFFLTHHRSANTRLQCLMFELTPLPQTINQTTRKSTADG